MLFDRTYFSGKTAVVTGAASGVGLALCEELLTSHAAKVTMLDFNRDRLYTEGTRLEQSYPEQVSFIVCDVTNQEAVIKAIDKAAEFGNGQIDLLINCAGAAFVGKFTTEPDEGDSSLVQNVLTNADWEKAFALNFYGALYGCRAVVPYMEKQERGQIVNIISAIAFSPMAYQSAYAATKSALLALSLSLRSELQDYGILVNAATPGTTATAIFNGIKIPEEAQSPHSSASRILHGVVANNRLILGDDGDLQGANNNFLPDELGKFLDNVFLGYARQRREGTLSYRYQDGDPEESSLTRLIAMIRETPIEELETKVFAAVKKYFSTRDEKNVNSAYYNGKNVIVTGGASGIGFALVNKLLVCGANKVIIADISNKLQEIEEGLSLRYPDCVKGVFCNVAMEDSVRNMIKESESFMDGKIDLLINCAGIGQTGITIPMSDAELISEESYMKVESIERWKQVLDINFFGALYGCREVLPLMLKQGNGQIVNIISGTAFIPMPYQALYSASKAALSSFTLTIRYEYGDYGIKINAATPGTVATPIFEQCGVPENAQSPEDAALTILTGVQRNDRLISGDYADFLGVLVCNIPNVAPYLDSMMLPIARSRRIGNLADYGKINKCAR